MFYDKEVFAKLFTSEYFFNWTEVSESVIPPYGGQFQAGHCRVGVKIHSHLCTYQWDH